MLDDIVLIIETGRKREKQMIKEKFKDYNLSEEVLKAIELLKFTTPTKVQKEVMPAILNEEDVIVKSQTGSGKTASFGIPICELVDWEENKPQALVIAPTRELAIQVKEDIFNIGRFKRLKVVPVYGKAPFYIQEKELKQKTHVVVGTPGRLIDHIEKGTLDTSKIKYLVIDEADEMLNMGFIDQLHSIVASLPKNRITMLFSATIPSDIEYLCERFMKEPKTVEIEEENTATDRIIQVRYKAEEDEKIGLLRDITLMENPDSCMIFCNTKQQVDDVDHELSMLDYTCDKIHGGMEQRDRLKVMNDFKRGYFRYLIATDVAARGIDVDNISLVVNYDIPQETDSYVHRIGRTGRQGKEGKAVTFVMRNEKRFLNDIQSYIGKEIELKTRPDAELVDELKEAFHLKMDGEPELKEEKGALLSTNILKLHINAGKKTKMRAVDIVGTLCSLEGMTAADIGIINIMDISTYVEILNNKGEMVWKELQNKPIKGRMRKVSKANR